MQAAQLREINASDALRPPSSPELQGRALELLRTEIQFIPNPEFQAEHCSNAKFVNAILAELQSVSSGSAGLPVHLRLMCESKLLSQQQETALFREMNYLKFRANVLRSRIDPDDDARLLETVETVEALLSRVQSIRNQIVQANMRLVMSVVKKFVTAQQPFDELLSDGIITLMQAVEKFDFDRGFRFSTYAYRSIARGAYRNIANARGEEARRIRDAGEWVFEQKDDRTSAMADKIWSNLRAITTTMLDQLDRRERFIIRSRYALGAHRKTRTFQYLADKLGISKERVRQLEQRAVAKLRSMADELELDEVSSAII